MNARFVKLDPAFLRSLEPRDAELQSFVRDRSVADAACASGVGVIDGAYPLAAFGVLPREWAGRGLAWLLLSTMARPRHFVKLLPMAYEWLEVQAAIYPRLEATALADLPRNCAFLEKLGFVREGLMRRYDPEGRDHILYARVSE